MPEHYKFGGHEPSILFRAFLQRLGTRAFRSRIFFLAKLFQGVRQERMRLEIPWL